LDAGKPSKSPVIVANITMKTGRLERTVEQFAMPEYLFEIVRWTVLMGVVCLSFGVVDGLNNYWNRKMEDKLGRRFK
jgi:hypothetical protein